MATSEEARIKALLFARLAALTGPGAALPVAWPNVSHTPGVDGKFLRADFITGRVDRICIGSNEKHRQLGLLQVSVMWPLNKGTDDPTDIAGDVRALYPADLVLSDADVRVRVIKRPAVAAPIVEEQRVMIPVTVEWEAFL